MVTVAPYENTIDLGKDSEEVARLTAVVKIKPGLNITPESAWYCVCKKVVIADATGLRTDVDQTGPPIEDYTFTISEMVFIISELRQLRSEYSYEIWFSIVPLTKVLVMCLYEYIASPRSISISHI